MTESRDVEVSIEAAPQAVYDFIVEPTNLPRWAAGLGSEVVRDGDRWTVRMGTEVVEVEFVPRNNSGIADHYVTFPDGSRFHNPLRVSPQGSTSRVTFTVNRLPGSDDEAFARDCAAVAADLQSLKVLLES